MRSLALITLFCGIIGTGIVACGDEEDSGGSSGGSAGTSSGGKGGKGGTSGNGSGDAGAPTAGSDSVGGQSAAGAGNDGPGGTDSGQGGTDGSAGSDAAGGVTGDAGASSAPCSNVTAEGDAIAETVGEGALPTPAGGQVEEGTYELTAWEVYAPEDPNETAMRTITLEVTGNEWHVASSDGNNVLRFNAEFSTNGDEMTLTPTCPVVGNPDTFGYTSANGEIWIIREDQSRVEIFTMQ